MLKSLMYDPKIGRFLSPDPLLEMFPEQTPYQYAFNSPLIWKDPSGLKGEKERGDRILGYVEETLELGEYVVVYLYYQTNDDGYCNPLVPYNKSLISKNIYRKSRDENDEAITVGDNNPTLSGIKSSGGGLSSLGSGVVNQGGIQTNNHHSSVDFAQIGINYKDEVPFKWTDNYQGQLPLPPFAIRNKIKEIVDYSIQNNIQFERGGQIRTFLFGFTLGIQLFHAVDGFPISQTELCSSTNTLKIDLNSIVDSEKATYYAWIPYSIRTWDFHIHPEVICPYNHNYTRPWPSEQDENNSRIYPETVKIVFGIGNRKVYLFKGNKRYVMRFDEFFNK